MSRKARLTGTTLSAREIAFVIASWASVVAWLVIESCSLLLLEAGVVLLQDHGLCQARKY